MGGEQFGVKREAWSAEEAFRAAVEEAFYEHGHGGYTGTIAEKTDFRVRTPPKLVLDELHERRKMLANTALGREQSIDLALPAWREWSEGLCEENENWGPAECVVLREPETPRRLTKAQARKLAREVFGESAGLEMERTRGVVRARVRIESSVRAPRAIAVSAEGKDAAEAYGKLFAKKGLYLFFGWASS